MEFSVSILPLDEDEAGGARRAAARRKKVFDSLAKAFPQCRRKRDRNSIELISSSESVADKVVAYMKKHGGEFEIIRTDYWTGDELARARWVELIAKVGPADAGQDWEPLNKFPNVLCGECGRYNERVLPEPYWISRVVLAKKDEIFRALNGIVIVNERVKELMLELIDKQVAWGEVRLVGERGEQAKRADRGKCFYWMQPRFSIGGFAGFEPIPHFCPGCGEALDSEDASDTGEKVQSNRVVVEYFGKKEWNIARGGTLGHYRRPSGAVIQQRQVFVSGGLWAYLFNCGVKGLLAPEEGLFSARGEPPVEEQRRFAERKSIRKDRVRGLKM